MVSRLLAAASLALMLVVAPASAQAQEPSPSHLAAARDLVLLIGVASSADEIVPALVEDLKRQNLTRPELSKDLDEVLKVLAPELELQRQQAATVLARVYAKWMTEPELREVIAFYKTPTGAKFSRVQTDIVEEGVKELTAWSAQLAEYLMTRARVEMNKRGHQLQ